MSQVTLFSGSANPALANSVANYLKIDLGKTLVTQFSDGETRVEILENIRGKDVFILQSISKPSNDHLMEILLLVDAARRASACRITAVIPYFGYARQDRRLRSARVPISAKIIADLLETVGVDHVLTVDLHSAQIQGFFSISVDNLYASKVLIEDMLQKNHQNPLIVSPDGGGVVRARAFAKHLNEVELAIIDKRRPQPNESMVMNIIGDVQNRHCLIVDDLVDTANTICLAATALKEKGAKTVSAYCTHPVFSGKAIENIMNSALDEMVVTDTISLTKQAISCSKIRQLSIAYLLAESIHRSHSDISISSMFD